MTYAIRPGACLPLIMSSLAVLTLGACTQEPSTTPDDAVTSAAAPVAAPVPASTPAPAATPTNMPAQLVPASEKGEKGARNVLLGFARALENEQFDTAYALLGGPERSGQSQAQFVAQWGDLSDISVAIVGGEMDAGAGSQYYTVQATVTAKDPEGRPIRFEGPISLRRVNDVDGATKAQLRWHLESFNVVQTH